MPALANGIYVANCKPAALGILEILHFELLQLNSNLTLVFDYLRVFRDFVQVSDQ